MEVVTEAQATLLSFFDNDLFFFSSREWQLDDWGQATSDRAFWIRMMQFTYAWECVLTIRNELSTLSPPQFMEIEKVYDMIKDFERTRDFPNSPQEYVVLIKTNPEWRKIQQHAKRVYDALYYKI